MYVNKKVEKVDLANFGILYTRQQNVMDLLADCYIKHNQLL